MREKPFRDEWEALETMAIINSHHPSKARNRAIGEIEKFKVWTQGLNQKHSKPPIYLLRYG